MSKTTDDRSITLHEEIQAILREKRSSMTTKEIADEVNRRGNYHKKDGSAVTDYQVHGRTKNYDTLFTRDGSKVGLVEW
jgi:uncharacterized protein YrrD